jgi:preprotein translocase subunit SecA
MYVKLIHMYTHIIYSARRDGETMGQVFRFLGLTVGVVQSYQKEGIYICICVYIYIHICIYIYI